MKKHEEKGWEWDVTLRTCKRQLVIIHSASRTELLLDIVGKGARISRHIAFLDILVQRDQRQAGQIADLVSDIRHLQPHSQELAQEIHCFRYL
jgi:hypothetical protein